MTKEKEILELIFPTGTFEWFDVIEGNIDQNDLHVTLEEKNIPPLSEEHKNKKVISKGFKNITITDFPIRGRRTLLTFKRRYWQIKDEEKLLKRDLKMNFPGTQLAKEFADFLKEDGGRESGLADFYRRVSKNPRESI
ncbi:MAG: transposase [Candidatus Moraniibacteriota bacterium]